MVIVRSVVALVCAVALSIPAFGQSKSSAEDEYYKIVSFNPPEDVVLECGGVEMMPDGKLAVATRGGDIYTIGNAFDGPPANATYNRRATRLHEILRLPRRDRGPSAGHPG